MQYICRYWLVGECGGGVRISNLGAPLLLWSTYRASAVYNLPTYSTYLPTNLPSWKGDRLSIYISISSWDVTIYYIYILCILLRGVFCSVSVKHEECHPKYHHIEYTMIVLTTWWVWVQYSMPKLFMTILGQYDNAQLLGNKVISPCLSCLFPAYHIISNQHNPVNSLFLGAVFNVRRMSILYPDPGTLPYPTYLLCPPLLY